MSNEIDDLMSLDPLSMTKDNIDSIITHYRSRRAATERGEKPAKASAPKTSLAQIMDSLAPKPAGEPVKRRV